MKPLSLDQLEKEVRDAKNRLRLIRELRETRHLIALESMESAVGDKFQRVLKSGADLICESFGLNQESLLSQRRTEQVVIPRMLLIWLCRELTDASSATIGMSLGKDHSTVIHACKSIRNRMETSADFRQSAEHIKARIAASLVAKPEAQ